MIVQTGAMQHLNDHVLFFYGWWQFSVCLFACIALIAIWWHIGKMQNDFGQVWLALSVLCWSISGAFEIYFIKTNTTSEIIIEGWRSIWSLLNSLFILLALPWFRYLPEAIGHIIKSKYWIYIVGIPFLFSILPTLSRMISGTVIAMINELDVYYALFTLLFLGYVLWESFLKRRLKALAFLSLLCILIALVAQIYKVYGTEMNLPSSDELYITFSKNKLSSGKIEYLIFLKGFPGTEKRKVKLTPALFELFLTFAQRKKSEDDWLEIKPKNFAMSNKTFDINDYNQVKRLLIAILDGVFGKDSWTVDHHLNPLKTTLFEMSEKRDRKIRLKIDQKNISL